MKYLIILFLLFAANVSAQNYDVSIKGALSNNQTPEQLIEQLTEQLKIKSLVNSPTYVEHEKSLKGEGFSEDFYSLNAGLVTISNQKEVWSTSSKGVISVVITANAFIDMSAFKIQVDQLRKNRQLEKQSVVANQFIEKLQSELDKLDNEFESNDDHSSRVELARKREVLLSELNNNLSDSNYYEVSPENRRRLLLSSELLSNKIPAQQLGHMIGEKVYTYLDKYLVVSQPALLSVGEYKIAASFTFEFDPLPLVGLLEPWFNIEINKDYLFLYPKATAESFELDVAKIVHKYYLSPKVGVEIAGVTQWHALRVDFDNRYLEVKGTDKFKLFYTTPSNVSMNFVLPKEALVDLSNVKVGKRLF